MKKFLTIAILAALSSSCNHAYFIEKDLLTFDKHGNAKLTRIAPAVLYVPKTNPDTIFRLTSVPVKKPYSYGN